ncbi:MAG: ribosomal protection-like ABC-F family protein [Oscillospiraceae bacterium]
MALIDVKNLSFAYDGSHDELFENASFRFDTGWRLGLTGRNGRGKTTFLKLLLGQYEYRGSITSPVDFVYFPFPVPDPWLSGLEAAEAACPGLEEWRLRREMSLLELAEDVLYRPWATLSGGEQTKLLLAALFLNEGSFPLIDEPTNHLDARGRQVVGRYLKGQKGFLLVSHDRDFLDESVDHILSINRGGIEVCQGNFSAWWENRRRQDQFELEENARLKKEIRRLEATAREKARWSDKAEAAKIGQCPCDRGYIGHKAAKVMARSKAIEKRSAAAAEEKAALLKNIEQADALRLSQSAHHARRLVELRDVSVSYGGVRVCGPVSFAVERGERVALLGPNGSGKSSLLKLLLGEDIAHSGTMEAAPGLRVSYVAQSAEGLTGDLSAYAEAHAVDESLFKALLRKLGFRREQFDKRLEDFSAGQKKKVLLARSLCEDSQLLVWDEPLNYIDVISRMQIEELLLDSRPSILFVEHDRAFCRRVATQTVELP